MTTMAVTTDAAAVSSAQPSTSKAVPYLPTTPGKRADTLAIKEALAQYLSPQDGRLYWAALVDFLTGKITREEWDLEGRKLLGTEEGS
jgi:hypothetical protein